MMTENTNIIVDVNRDATPFKTTNIAYPFRSEQDICEYFLKRYRSDLKTGKDEYNMYAPVAIMIITKLKIKASFRLVDPL